MILTLDAVTGEETNKHQLIQSKILPTALSVFNENYNKFSSSDR